MTDDMDAILAERSALSEMLQKRKGVVYDGGGMAMEGEHAYDMWYTDARGLGWKLTLSREPAYDR